QEAGLDVRCRRANPERHSHRPRLHTARISRSWLCERLRRRGEPAATRRGPSLLLPLRRSLEPDLESHLPGDRIRAGRRRRSIRLRGRLIVADRYAFVMVGGGSAGSALANRLTADGSNRVLALEAGRPDWRFDVFIHMPAALAFPIGSALYDWRYESEPEPFMNGRRIYHARG